MLKSWKLQECITGDSVGPNDQSPQKLESGEKKWRTYKK